MARVKFGDIAKGATEVLSDDYQVEGYQFKSKMNTTFDGANVTAAMDLWPAPKADNKSGAGLSGLSGGGKKDDKPVQTPAKITWKFPKPFGVAGVSVDKLEMTKSGDFAGEFAFNEKSHKVKDLSLSAKTDFASMDKATVGATYTGIADTRLQLKRLGSAILKATVGATYTGIADTRLQLDTKPSNPVDFTFEVTRAIQQFTIGAKLSKKDMTPNIGVRYTSGPIFAALLASEKFKKYQAYAMYKVSNDLILAGTYEHVMPAVPAKFSAGLSYDARCCGKVKAKVAQDGTLSCSYKYQFSKGFTSMFGAKYNHIKKNMSWGCLVIIE